MAIKKKTAADESKREETFALGQFLSAERFNGRKDLLRAVLSEKRNYSVSEAEKKMDEFMKGKVK